MNFAVALLATSLAAQPRIVSEDYSEFLEPVPSRLRTSYDVTPGSRESYEEMKTRRAATFDVYRNGFVVTNLPSVVITDTQTNQYASVPFSEYGLYYVFNGMLYSVPGYYTDRLSNDVIRAFSPTFCDATEYARCVTTAGTTWAKYVWTARDLATNENFSALIGKDLYALKGSRLDAKSLNALNDTYEAYFERIYYPSVGDSNSWDTAEWGPTTPSSDFRFNDTNGVYWTVEYFDLHYPTNIAPDKRGIANTKRPSEGTNIKNLRAHLQLGKFSDEVSPSREPVMNCPSFLYRPGWLLDSTDTPEGSAQYLYWSSSFMPPLVTNQVDVADPQEQHFWSFPTFDWTTHPIGRRLVGGGFVFDNIFSTCSVSFANVNPCKRLFQVLGGAPDGVDEIQPYNFGQGGLYRWMTNAYPVISRRYASDKYSLEKYRDSFTGAASGHADLNDLAMANHMLAFMNRTIHIPYMKLNITNETVKVKRTARYSVDPVSVEYTRDGTTFNNPTIDGEIVRKFNVSRNGAIEDTVSNELASVGIDSVKLHVSMISQNDPDVVIVGSTDNDYFLESINLYDATFPSVGSGTHTIDIIEVSDQGWSFAVTFKENGTTYTGTFSGIPPWITITVAPAFSVQRSYEYEHPHDYGVILGKTQPGSSALSRQDISMSSYLAKRHISYSSATNEWYGNNSSYGSRSDLINNVKSYSQTCDTDAGLKAQVLHDGHGYSVPSSFVEMPSGTTVSSAFAENLDVTEVLINPVTPEKEWPVTNTTYEAYFDVTNIYAWATEVVTNDTTVFSIISNEYRMVILPDGEETNCWVRTILDMNVSFESTTNEIGYIETLDPYEIGPITFNSRGDVKIVNDTTFGEYTYAIDDCGTRYENNMYWEQTLWVDWDGTVLSNSFFHVGDEGDVTPWHDDTRYETGIFTNTTARYVTLDDAKRVEEIHDIHVELAKLRMQFTIWDGNYVSVDEMWWVSENRIENAGAGSGPYVGSSLVKFKNRPGAPLHLDNVWSPTHDLDIESRLRIMTQTDWKWKKVGVVPDEDEEGDE